MNLSRYLRQSIVYKQRIGTDAWGTPVYAAPKRIKARVTRKHRVKLLAREFDRNHLTEYLTALTNVQIGDMMDDDIIYGVEDVVDRTRVIGTRAYPQPPSGFSS